MGWTNGFAAVSAAARTVMRTLQESQLFGSPGSINQSRPVSDPQHQGTNNVLSFFTNQTRDVIGTITAANPTAYCYRVSLENGLAPIVACAIAHSSLSTSGPRDHTTYAVGDTVLVKLHRQLGYGFILGVVPPITYSSKQCGAGQLLFTSRKRQDEAHRAQLDLEDYGNLINFLAGRPRDVVANGQVGWTTENGLAFNLDSKMFQLSINEMTGIFGYLRDSLLRIAAVNLQQWTSLTQSERLNDQDEAYIYDGQVVYPWEQLGRFSRGEAFEKHDAQKWQFDEPHYGKVEPKDDRATPWHRLRDIGGYLGQGRRTIVQIPPKDATDDDTTSYAGGDGLEKPEFIGVSSDHSTLDGRREIAFAKGGFFGKQLVHISPAAQQPQAQGEGKGDDNTNYKASGLLGDGPEHKIKGDVEANADDKAGQRVAGYLDELAYRRNFASIHPFFFHKNDWHVPDEHDLKFNEGATVKKPKFAELKEKMVIPPPDAIKLNIDHRLKDQEYYPNLAGIYVTPEGYVMIFDGFGGCIKMGGGNIEITCPGDVSTRAGRDIINLAGFDWITRAKNSGDITTTDGDFRIKTGRNFHTCSGVTGKGGTLLENRAEAPVQDFEKPGEDTESSGVVIRCPKTEAVTLAKNIYQRTGSKDGTIEQGDIVLDAGQGKGNIVTHSDRVTSYMEQGVYHYFGTEGQIRKGNEFTEQSVTVAAPMNIIGQTVVVGTFLVRGSIVVPSGHIATEQAQGNNCRVNELKGVPLNEAYSVAATVENRGKQTLPQQGKQAYKEELQTPFYDPEKAGNADVVRDAQFSLRTMDQYGTKNFELWEDPWQQMDRVPNPEAEKWKEEPVDFQGQPTYPYPGRENYEGEKYLQQNLKLWEFTGDKGSATSRGTSPDLAPQYAEPKFEQVVKKKLDEYTVIGRRGA